jgi:hypothetical protein
MNVEIGTEAALFLFWEYINQNFFAVWCPSPLLLYLTDGTRSNAGLI